MSVTKERRSLDPGILALSRLDRILAPLADDEQRRCIEWLRSKYDSSGPAKVFVSNYPIGTCGQE